MSNCKKFCPNIFYKSKCSNCFRQKDEHTAEALECNKAARSVARSGYLFVAPDWDFSVPLNRTKRWQRRWFVLYDDGELTYSVDEHPETVPQGSVDMCQVLEVTSAEDITGHPYSLALTGPDRVTFIKAASREETRWWVELLTVFSRRHKRNATFPGGRVSPNLHQLGRSSSPQPSRFRHLSCSRQRTKLNYKLQSKEQKIRQNTFQDLIPATNKIDSTNETVTQVLTPIQDSLNYENKIHTQEWDPDSITNLSSIINETLPDSSTTTLISKEVCIKKGWLWLQSGEEWVRRWVVLHSSTMNVFLEQDENSIADITIELSTVIDCSDIPTKSKYGFQILWNGQTVILGAVTVGVRSSWQQALKSIVPNIIVNNNLMPVPSVPRSLLVSSDEEYRTASESGRRGSEDWTELPPSPPLMRTSLNKMKERVRNRSHIYKCRSRQSTLDSTSTDELDLNTNDHDNTDFHNVVNKQNMEIDDLQKQLTKAVNEIHNLEDELNRSRKVDNLKSKKYEYRQRDEIITEKDQICILKEQLLKAEKYIERCEEKCRMLSKEIISKQNMITFLEDELKCTHEKLEKNTIECDKLYKRIHEMEAKGVSVSRRIPVDSLGDLTSIDLNVDLNSLGNDELIEFCRNIKTRFEKAVNEIRAMKKELRESHAKYDNLELNNFYLKRCLETCKQDAQAEVALMAIRLDHLTTKLAAAEKQLRVKCKQEIKGRRSLSLKVQDHESGINKEIEERVSELESKIILLEKSRLRKKCKKDHCSDKNSLIDDKSLRRLRRRSLEGTSAPESIKLLIRLNALESKVGSVNNSTESLNNVLSNITTDSTKNYNFSEKMVNSNNSIWLRMGESINDCLSQINSLKRNKNKTESLNDNKLGLLEKNLIELSNILYLQNCTEHVNEYAAANGVVKQLQTLLVEKLISINEKKRTLYESNKLDNLAYLQILAEKIAYENILIGRIQDALHSSFTSDKICKRLMHKEVKETEHLLLSLKNKLNGIEERMPPTCKTSAEYLSKVLANCLTVAIQNSGKSSKRTNIEQHNKQLSLQFLIDEQARVGTVYNLYKMEKLPQLAEALAMKAVSFTSDKTRILYNLNNEFVEHFHAVARETANAELILSEINHVLIRAAHLYEASMTSDYEFFFSFFASERASLELWVESVESKLYTEISNSITELTELYQNSLNKFKIQNWKEKIESERSHQLVDNLLSEFADIVAHKALIDAKISVLIGQYNNSSSLVDSGVGRINIDKWIEYDRCWTCLENHSLVQVNQSLETEFKSMIEKYSNICLSTLDKPIFKQVCKTLYKLSDELHNLQVYLNVNVSEVELSLENWYDVSGVCQEFCNQVQLIRNLLISTLQSRLLLHQNRLEKEKLHSSDYQIQADGVRNMFKNIVGSCGNKDLLAKLKQLQNVWEEVFTSMEQWYCCAVQKMEETHLLELKGLEQDKEQALTEEAQATLAALDAMRKAHEAEVQREVTKFKQDFLLQQRDEVSDLSEKLSLKKLEVATLEEQLRNVTKQLVQAHQHILQLKINPQIPSM